MLKLQLWAPDLDLWGPLWPRRCRWTSSPPPSSHSPTGSCLGATAALASCRPSRSPACLHFWRTDGRKAGIGTSIKLKKKARLVGVWDLVPADAQYLVVIPLAGDFQQLLRSLHTLSDFLVVVELSGLLVVLDGCRPTRRIKTKDYDMTAAIIWHHENLVQKGNDR